GARVGSLLRRWRTFAGMTPVMAPLLLTRRGNAFDLFSESPDLRDRGILRRLPHPVGQDLRRRGGRRTQRRVQKRRRFAHQSLTGKPLPSAVAQLTCERS